MRDGKARGLRAHTRRARRHSHHGTAFANAVGTLKQWRRSNQSTKGNEARLAMRREAGLSTFPKDTHDRHTFNVSCQVPPEQRCVQ